MVQYQAITYVPFGLTADPINKITLMCMLLYFYSPGGTRSRRKYEEAAGQGGRNAKTTRIFGETAQRPSSQ